MPMDQRLYVAAKEGDMKVLEEYKDQFATQLTRFKNTVLHVAAQYDGFSQNPFEWVPDPKEFVAMAGMELVFSLNSNRDTCIHLAARNRQVEFIEAYINYMKSCGGLEIIDIESGVNLLSMTNNSGNTALHEALLMGSGDTKIIKLLVEENAGFKYLPNKAGKSPLYLAAAEARSQICVDLILKNCSSPSYAGPYGTTALHAAAMSVDAGFVEMILRKEPSLTKQADDFGWNALHLAAYLGRKRPVKALLMADKHMAYDTTKDTIKEGNKTPLQLATVNDKEEVMAVILEQCPDTIEAVTSQGQTILHLLADALGSSKARKLFDLDIIDHRDCGHFLNVRPYLKNQEWQRDLDGNMPFDVGREGQKSVLSHPCYKDFISLDNESKARKEEYIEMKSEYNKKLKERTEVWKERANTHLIVATLIITVSFAAGFTIPGGYDSDDGRPTKGMAILWKKAAFQAFAITDTIAMISSTAAVFLLYLVTYEREHKRLKRYEAAGILVMVAMVAMMIAFMTGLYTVLPSPNLAVFICVICSLSLTIFLFFWGRTFYDEFTEARKMSRMRKKFM